MISIYSFFWQFFCWLKQLTLFAAACTSNFVKHNTVPAATSSANLKNRQVDDILKDFSRTLKESNYYWSILELTTVKTLILSSTLTKRANFANQILRSFRVRFFLVWRHFKCQLPPDQVKSCNFLLTRFYIYVKLAPSAILRKFLRFLEWTPRVCKIFELQIALNWKLLFFKDWPAVACKSSFFLKKKQLRVYF